MVNLNEYCEPEARVKHIKRMKDYRLELEEVWNKEKVLRKEIRSMNSAIGIDLPKLFVESLSVEENGLLSLLK